MREIALPAFLNFLSMAPLGSFGASTSRKEAFFLARPFLTSSWYAFSSDAPEFFFAKATDAAEGPSRAPSRGLYSSIRCCLVSCFWSHTSLPPFFWQRREHSGPLSKNESGDTGFC